MVIARPQPGWPQHRKEEGQMKTLKQDAMKALSTLPEDASIDDIMYRLYVIEKVRKGKEAVRRGETISVDELRREMESW